MALTECSNQLVKASKDLIHHWRNVQGVWSDQQSKDFEQQVVVPIEQDVRSALDAMNHMNQVLMKIQNDCE